MLERINNLLNDDQLQASAWERGFLESIQGQATKDYELSPAQINILERVEQANSQEQRNLLEEWLSRWDSERAEIARVVASYYSWDGYYFLNLCRKVLVENKPLSPAEYRKLCENKYATKVVEAHFAEPKYPVNSVVQVRANPSQNRNYREENGGWTNLTHAHAVVIEADALPVRRAAKGAKVYKILPFGASRAYYVSESDLKKARKIKK